MKDHSKTHDYCKYSFDDLYKAAFKKGLNEIEKKKFQGMSQENINRIVQQWADKAGWNTAIKKGGDKKIYLAFYP